MADIYTNKYKSRRNNIIRLVLYREKNNKITTARQAMSIDNIKPDKILFLYLP
jgi:hypothetical protein